MQIPKGGSKAPLRRRQALGEARESGELTFPEASAFCCSFLRNSSMSSCCVLAEAAPPLSGLRLRERRQKQKTQTTKTRGN